MFGRSIHVLRAPHRAHPEDDLQQAIVAFHAAAVSQVHAVLYAVPNGEKRDPITAARLSGINAAARDQLPDDMALMPAGLGLLSGVADLHLLLSAARLVLIEVKVPEIVAAPATLPLFGKTTKRPRKEVLHRAGVQSKTQRRFQAGVTALGHAYHIIRSVEAYADLLEACGVPLRCRPWGPGVNSARLPVSMRQL